LAKPPNLISWNRGPDSTVEQKSLEKSLGKSFKSCFFSARSTPKIPFRENPLNSCIFRRAQRAEKRFQGI